MSKSWEPVDCDFISMLGRASFGVDIWLLYICLVGYDNEKLLRLWENLEFVWSLIITLVYPIVCCVMVYTHAMIICYTWAHDSVGMRVWNNKTGDALPRESSYCLGI